MCRRSYLLAAHDVGQVIVKLGMGTCESLAQLFAKDSFDLYFAPLYLTRFHFYPLFLFYANICTCCSRMPFMLKFYICFVLINTNVFYINGCFQHYFLLTTKI